ncbi:MAG: iron ABC transporter permease [Desulfurococcales archaeon]|nr:iron ABC transporter permease [Desulfurococcales archaeon]
MAANPKNMGKILILFLITTFLMLLSLASLSIGPYTQVNIRDVIDYLTGGGTNNNIIRNIISYRLTRTISAVIVGAGLAASGLTLQYILRNPLADPFLLGVSAGAALGVVISQLVFGGKHLPALYTIALASGLLGFMMVLFISIFIGTSATGLIIAGISVSYLLGGVSMILIVKNADKIPGALLWLFGTVAYTTKHELLYSSILTIISIIILIIYSKKINTLILGDDVSTSLGVDVNKLRIISSAIASITAASLVALAGPVGFIGLAGPWLARLLVGSLYIKALITSLITGSMLLLSSDITVRIIGGASELPLTAITALYGGPILFYLTLKSMRGL